VRGERGEERRGEKVEGGEWIGIFDLKMWEFENLKI
jgi:hypothetical protein